MIHPDVDVALPTMVSGRVGGTVSYRIAVTNTGDSPLVDLTVQRSGAGLIGQIAALAAGGAVSLRTVEALGAARVHTDLVTVVGTDRSGAPTTGAVRTTVLASRSPGRHPDTAFTGEIPQRRAEASGHSSWCLGRRTHPPPSAARSGSARLSR